MSRVQRAALRKHYVNPKEFTQADVLKKLELGRDYNTLYRIFYQYIIEQS